VVKRRAASAPLVSRSFAGFRFPPEVILLAVRWYLRYGLSYRNVEELLAERGVDVDHVTIYRWVQRFTPLLIDAARPCRHAVRGLLVRGRDLRQGRRVWRYVYRAVDQFGQVIDVYVSRRRDLAAARRFFAVALGDHDRPAEVMTDKAPSLIHVVEELLLTGVTSRSGSPTIVSRVTTLGSMLNAESAEGWRAPNDASALLTVLER
jgi:transposase, IS6 family